MYFTKCSCSFLQTIYKGASYCYRDIAGKESKHIFHTRKIFLLLRKFLEFATNDMRRQRFINFKRYKFMYQRAAQFLEPTHLCFAVGKCREKEI